MTVRAFAPGTVANLGPGLDILGLALEGAGDTVRIERAPEPGITIRDSGHPDIPRDASRNTAGIAAARVLEYAGAAAPLPPRRRPWRSTRFWTRRSRRRTSSRRVWRRKRPWRGATPTTWRRLSSG